MIALIRPLLARLRARIAPLANWTCDRCRAVNSDSVLTCYRCGG